MSVYNAFTDQELAVLLKESDKVAYTEIYERYSGVLYAHAYNKVRDRELAKDLLQDLFTWLWNNRETIQITTSVSSYLYSAIRNGVFRFIAHEKVKVDYVASINEAIQTQQDITDHRIRENQLKELIEKEISNLPEKMREIFLLSRKEQLSHKEIADRLGLAEPTVKKQVNNALKILRVKLGFIAYLYFLIRF